MFFQRFFIAKTPSMMASELPIQEVPTAPESSLWWVGTLNRRPIMETQRFWMSADCGYWLYAVSGKLGSGSTAFSDLLIVDKVLGERLGHELLRLFFHVGGDEGGQVEHGVAVEAELVLDHAIGDLPGHLALGHLMARQILGGKLGAIDAGGEAVLVVGELQRNLLDSLGQLVVDIAVLVDGGEMDHFGGGPDSPA